MVYQILIVRSTENMIYALSSSIVEMAISINSHSYAAFGKNFESQILAIIRLWSQRLRLVQIIL